MAVYGAVTYFLTSPRAVRPWGFTRYCKKTEEEAGNANGGEKKALNFMYDLGTGIPLQCEICSASFYGSPVTFCKSP